jgi:hypothetical protein
MEGPQRLGGLECWPHCEFVKKNANRDCQSRVKNENKNKNCDSLPEVLFSLLFSASKQQNINTRQHDSQDNLETHTIVTEETNENARLTKNPPERVRQLTFHRIDSR